MSNTGWIKLHRKITDHWLWEDKPFARGQAMIDLLILAGYNNQPKYVDGNLDDRDYDFGALERQLFEKQMTG